MTADPQVQFSVKELLASESGKAEVRHNELIRVVQGVDAMVGLIDKRVTKLEQAESNRKFFSTKLGRVMGYGAITGALVSVPYYIHHIGG